MPIHKNEAIRSPPLVRTKKMNSDKLTELEHYNNAYKSLLEKEKLPNIRGSEGMPLFLRTPYVHYESQILSIIKPEHRVLELCAGTGLHTKALLETGADVVVTDIASYALNLVRERFGSVYSNFTTELADIEKLPFRDACFDVVACAGSLSYGEPLMVDSEIERVLRPGGYLVFVDSFNENPIYRLNRWYQYILGKRTKGTFERIPDADRLIGLSSRYSSIDVQYFGAFTFIMPFFCAVIGEERSAMLSVLV